MIKSPLYLFNLSARKSTNSVTNSLIVCFVLVMEVDDIEPEVTVSYYVLKFPNMHV